MDNKIQKVIELGGIFSVVLSLLFVGYQLILDRRVAMGEAYQARSISRQEVHIEFLTDEAYVRLLAEDWISERPGFWFDALETEFRNSEKPEIDAMEEVARKFLRAQSEVVGIDNTFVQFELGLLEEGTWNDMAELTEILVTTDPYRYAGYNATSTTHPDFKEFLSQFEYERNGT